jgi:hypothetical protein
MKRAIVPCLIAAACIIAVLRAHAESVPPTKIEAAALWELKYNNATLASLEQQAKAVAAPLLKRNAEILKQYKIDTQAGDKISDDGQIVRATAKPAVPVAPPKTEAPSGRK